MSILGWHSKKEYELVRERCDALEDKLKVWDHRVEEARKGKEELENRLQVAIKQLRSWEKDNAALRKELEQLKNKHQRHNDAIRSLAQEILEQWVCESY